MDFVQPHDKISAYKAGMLLNDKTEINEIDLYSIDQNLIWDFMRGYFEGNDFVLNDPLYYKKLIISFWTKKAAFLEKVCTFLNLPEAYYFSKDRAMFTLSGTNALDLLGKLYDDVDQLNYNKRCFDLWCRSGSSFFPKETPDDIFEWCKTREDAVAPSKERVSDSGFDLTIVDVVKKFHNKTTLYTTGIKVKPAFGWYLDVVPRSSIIKTGYMLANNVGVIDRAYTGEIMIALIKVDESAPDLELPCRIAQMIPRRIAHVNFKQVDDIERTSRNEGGFGSTG